MNVEKEVLELYMSSLSSRTIGSEGLRKLILAPNFFREVRRDLQKVV